MQNGLESMKTKVSFAFGSSPNSMQGSHETVQTFSSEINSSVDVLGVSGRSKQPAQQPIGAATSSASPQPTSLAGSGRRFSAWSKMKRNSHAVSAKSEKVGLLESLVSNVKSLAAEVREERLEEMEEAHDLRNCSMGHVCSKFHPARSSKFSGFSSGSTSSSGMRFGIGHGSERRLPTTVTLVERLPTTNYGKDVVVPVKEIPTFARDDKIFFLFSGVPNALRRAQELQPWLTPSAIISNFTLLIVTISCISFCIESLPEFYDVDPAPLGLQISSYVCMVWLTFELAVRLFFCPDVWAMLKMPVTWVDIVSNIPYYIEFGSGEKSIARILILIRLLRLTRILRVFDLSKHNVGMQSVWGSIVKSVSGITLFMLLLTVIMFVGSSLIYIAEMSEERFDNTLDTLLYEESGKPSPFQSILHTLWYVIATITTTGYGDIVPITPAGYLVASILILVGPFVIAFPTVILSANFQETHRELIDAIEQPQDSHAELSAEESRRVNEKKNAEFASVMRQFVPKTVQDDMRRREELLDRYIGRSDLSYTISVGAPPRNIVIRNDIALYDPLLMMRCAYADGEPEYGFQSNTGVTVTVRDNYPTGSIIRFQVLLHTAFTQEAAIMAVHQHRKKHPSVRITTVAPRPIKTLRVSMKSKHALLSHIHIVCTKYRDPFGTIPIEVVLTKPEALPVLLRYASSCSFHFTCEFHDATALDTTMFMGISEQARVEYQGTDEAISSLLATAFPNAVRTTSTVDD